MAERLRANHPYFASRVNPCVGCFSEVVSGALDTESAETLLYEKHKPSDRVRYILLSLYKLKTREAYSAFRTALRLHNFTEEWKMASALLPPATPEEVASENPGSWELPLTSIRGYLKRSVNLLKGQIYFTVGISFATADERSRYLKRGDEPGALTLEERWRFLLERTNQPDVMESFREALRKNDYDFVDVVIGKALEAEKRYYGLYLLKKAEKRQKLLRE